jgi:tRNA A-37 threonylcarbamoyl transferase component Bud32
MANDDARTVAERAQRLGLITEEQAQEALDEVGPAADADALLRVLERRGVLTSYQSQKLLKGDADGYFIGGYRVLYRVAAGSFGRVFRGEDPASGRVVAIKVLRQRWSKDAQRIELFEREGKVGLSLKHPNIVETLAVNHDSGGSRHYLVMDFIEGGNLRDFLAIRKKLEPAEALRLLEQAARGLAYAHTCGVTHRDIKLSNILISAGGAALLVDFGLATLYALGKQDDVQVERTVDYAALELATNVKHGDPRSDIYFLGCVFYEMLTGRPPWVKARDRHVRLSQHKFDQVTPITPQEVAGPPSLFHLVETMMAFNPQKRYQTMNQVLEAIRAVRTDLEGRGAVAAPGPPSVFVAERDCRLQTAIREKFKEMGYRVLLAGDPSRALDRFRQLPFEALVLDVGTTDEEGLRIFEHIMFEAAQRKLGCHGILLLNEDQADWVERIQPRPTVTVLVRPVTLKQLCRKLRELVPLP